MVQHESAKAEMACLTHRLLGVSSGGAAACTPLAGCGAFCLGWFPGFSNPMPPEVPGGQRATRLLAHDSGAMS